MEAKEIRSLLKQAREAIKEKDFKSALKHCKAVLKLDKNNYNAWVFIGAAAQELGQPDQSVAAFKRAIEVSPEQILAWQGLCSFYEKNETSENIPELLSVYKKFLDLYASEKDKKLEIFDKLICLLKKMNDKEKLLKTLKLKLVAIKGDNIGEYAVYKEIFDELVGETKLSNEDIKIQSEALQILVSDEKFSEDDCRRIISTCIDALYKGGMENHSLSLAFLMFKRHPNSFACLEFISRAAMNMYIDNKATFSGIAEISQKMNSFEMTSKGLPEIFEGFHLFLSKKYTDAILKLKEGLSKIEYCVQGWYFLSSSQLCLHRYSDSEISAKTGIEIAIKSKVQSTLIGKFYLILGKAFLGKQSWDSAIKALEKCLEYMEKTKDMLVTFCFTLLKIGQVEKAEQICQDLKEKFKEDPEVLQLEGYTLLLKKQHDQALQRLRQSVSLKESPFTLHLIGLVLWETKQADKSFKLFLKAVESDPFYAKNFMFLGHYYYYELYDKNKACVCYEKAFALDSSDAEIGMSLSQVLKELGKEDKNMEVLKKITEKASLGSCKWAWTQLGLYQLEKNEPTEAIFSFQKALRADPDSSHGWECLADAYLKRGSYESALKAFERVSLLNPKAMYPLYQIATIQKMRGFFTEAVEKFKNLLDLDSAYIPALIGLAETLMLFAKKSLDECIFGVSRDCCQEILNILARVAISNTRLSCLWKLAGDACTLPFHFDSTWFPIEVPSELLQDSNEPESCDKAKLLGFGSKFYGRALMIKESVSTLWHDLGVNCHYQSILAADESDQVSYAKKAFICLQKAISLCPNYEAHWTALGVIALGKGLKDYAYGQHFLIKSLQLNRHNAETWTNLGVLYLLKDNIKLSHSSFTMAQSSEPTYPICWLGQAFIASKVQYSETLDLFRHATTLGSHNEALIGYSKAICDTLLNTTDKESKEYKYNIEEMCAVVQAGDCALKFVANNCNAPAAFNILGLLLERQGIYNASLKAFERALKLLEERNKTEYLHSVRSNYARLLSINGFTKEALKEFLLIRNVDTSIICSFAFALYKDGQYEQAIKLFAQAFEKSKNPADKSHIKVAMAIVAMNIKGSDSPNPLTLLFESTQIAPASVYGLLALYAGGILKEELNLLLAARKELHPYKYQKEYASSAALLWAIHYHLMKGVQPARNELLKFLHCLPDDHRMWLQAASCLLEWDSKYCDVAAHCTKIGVFHGGCKERASQIFALSQMSKGYRKGALSAAQKAVHINPGNLNNWATLAAACHIADLDRKNVGWMFGFVKKLAKIQKVKPDILGWLVVMEIFHHINCGNVSDACALTNQALSITAFNSEISSCLQILDAVLKVFHSSGNLQPLFLAIKNNPKSFFGWNVLCQLLLDSGNVNEAEKTLSHFALTCEKIFPQWRSFPLLQLAVLSYKAMQTNSDEKEKWLKLGEEVTGKAVHIIPSSQTARFLQGLFALESENSNLARRSFEKASISTSIQENDWLTKMAANILELKNLKRAPKE